MPPRERLSIFTVTSSILTADENQKIAAQLQFGMLMKESWPGKQTISTSE